MVCKMKKGEQQPRITHWRFVLCAVYLVLSCNLLLLNNKLSIGSQNVGTMLTARDLAELLLIAAGAWCVFKRRTIPSKNIFVQIAIFVIICSSIALDIGFLSDFDTVTILREAVTASSWLAVILIPLLLCDESLRYAITWCIVIVGVLASIGVIIEVASGMTYHLVTPFTGDIDYSAFEKGQGLIRSAPQAWPIMQVAGSILIVALVRKRISHRLRYLGVIGLSIIAIGSVLTLSRTLIVGYGFMVAMLICCLIHTGEIKALVRMLCYLALGLACIICAACLLSTAKGDASMQLIINRYSTLLFLAEGKGNESMQELGGRDVEAKAALNAALDRPFTGYGFGARFHTFESSSSWTHNTLTHMVFKFGISGLIIYFALALGLMRSALRSAKYSYDSTLRFGLSLGLVNLIACSLFGNILFMPYLAHQTTFVLGVLVSCCNAGDRFRFPACTSHGSKRST